jgi:hypothetical protein
VPAEFSIAGAPLGDSAALTAAFGPAFNFPSQDVKFRHGERYASEAANRKFLGIPLGVYLGFTPSFSNNILTFTVDAAFGVCFARVASQDDPRYVVDVIIEADSTLDFSNHTAFPVNVVLKVRGALGLPHSAEISTQTATPTFPTEVLLGIVTGPNTIDVAEPFNRDTPFAYSGAPLGYGFMKDGAVEELLAAIAVSAEVVAARTDLSGFTHPSLVARLDADGAASALAGRLGKENRTIIADDFSIAAPTSTVNISRAFSRFHRNITGFSPIQDFEGFASETRIGAITSGVVPTPSPVGALTDDERNVCAVVDASTRARLTGADRQIAYGRLTYDEISLSGTDITFTNLSTTVTGTGTLFTSEVQPGDIIQDPVSGDFFEVDPLLPISSDTSLDISVAFPNATTPPATAPALRRRFTLDARTRTGPATETAFTIPASTIRVYFNAWQTVEVAQYDSLTEISQAFEETPVPSATTSLVGKALVATGIADGKAGAVFEVQEIGTQVGPNHISSISFSGAASGGSGIADITQRGPTGDKGDPGNPGTPGGVGPQGAQGQGFTNFDTSNLFQESALFVHSSLGSGAQYSFTTTMNGTEILFLTGGNSEWYSPFSFDSDDHWQIDNIEVVSGMQVRLSARVPTGGSPTGEVRFFLNAATR